MANRGFVYKQAFKFQYELLNFATNLRTLERNLEYFGKSFVKSNSSSRTFFEGLLALLVQGILKIARFLVIIVEIQHKVC